MTQDRIAKLSSIGFDFGEQRWNTGKMKQAHAAIEKGKAQEASQLLLLSSSLSTSIMPISDRFQVDPHEYPPLHQHHQHLGNVPGPDVADIGNRTIPDENVEDHYAAQQPQQQLLQLQQVLEVDQQQQQQNSGYRYFQQVPWDEQQQQQQYDLFQMKGGEHRV
jgi:hypothetical protein